MAQPLFLTSYDNNGNLTKDLNKGISNISYNSLSLPQVVTFSNGNTITYLYTTDGRKLRTVHVTNGTATTTDYCGNVIYENGTQKLLLTEEGYVDLVNSNTYYYYLKDHQGNNRVVISSSGTVMETNHYYPFGGVFSTSSSVQPYKYNGKELDTKNSLNWYDYGARHYDAALGRWHVVDPLAEKYLADTPYAYCGSNPVNRIDPTGMDWYENSSGNLFWQEGHKNIDGYTNIGSTATIGWGEDIFFNYYQNMGILGDKPANAIEQIASSPYLMQKAFEQNSGLSETSQLELFNTLQSKNKAGLGKAAGLFLVGELAGGVIGKAAGWALSKYIGITTKGYSSFAAFKKAHGKAGDGMAWHHIVEQNASNITKFGAQKIHNIDNIIKLPHGKGSIHAKVSGYYSSKIPGTNIRVRDYVNTLSYDEQYKYGIEILNKLGWKP